jgi:hypothetical protein
VKPFVGKQVEPRSDAEKRIQLFCRKQSKILYSALFGGQMSWTLMLMPGGAFLQSRAKAMTD